MNNYYVYAYLRDKSSSTAEAGTPYYIGKGKEKRYKSSQHNVSVPKNEANIIFICTQLTESTALLIEKFWIATYGRVDLGTGILRNKTDGGERPGNVAVWNKGVKYIEYFGPIIAAEIGQRMAASRYKKPKVLKEKIDRKGKTFAEIFGEDRAKIIRSKISDAGKGRTVSAERKEALKVAMTKNNIAKRPESRAKLSEKAKGLRNSQCNINPEIYAQALHLLNTTLMKKRTIAKMLNLSDGQVGRIAKYSTRMSH